MNITNVHGLPEALVRAVKNDSYKGGGDYSVTRLIDSPQMRALSKKFSAAVVEDVSDRIWSLMGQAVHHVLERSAEDDAIVEERYFMNVGDKVISGQVDRLVPSQKVIQDWKFVSTYKKDGDDSWTKQLNVLRILAKANGIEVDKLEIVAIFRDWQRAMAKRDPNYPQSIVRVIPVPVWTDEQAMDYINQRVAAHSDADAGIETQCTDEERWYAGTTFALMKVGGKRASKVAQSKEELGEPQPGYEIVERRGGYRRCEEFCSVSQFCPQYQKELQELKNVDVD
jgi:hypothetical protein